MLIVINEIDVVVINEINEIKDKSDAYCEHD